MNKYMTRRGFTLIELLVVVLIIGILAAVALPQYQKAVKKAQGEEVLVALHALDQSLATYAMENGNLCTLSNSTCMDSLNWPIPDLVNWERTTSPVADYGAPNCLSFRSQIGDATISGKWDAVTGARIETHCIGTDCAAYFGCSASTVTRCYGTLGTGCPSYGQSTAMECKL